MRSTVYLMLSFAALCSEVSPLMAQNPVSNRVVAPRDGFYRVERAADCVANSRYIFASSSFATSDYVLAAPSNSRHTSSSGNNMMAQVPIINGSFIAPPSNNVVWEYDSSKRTLRNVQSNEVLTTTGDNHVLQTISGSVPSNVYGSLHFSDGDPAFANGRLFPSDEYPLRFILERTKKRGPKECFVEWSDEAQAFKSYGTFTSGEVAADDIGNTVNPVRVFRYFSKGETLPTYYEQKIRVKFHDIEFATFCANHAYVVPEGTKAYIAVRNGRYLDLHLIDNKIPARTAVILMNKPGAEIDLSITFDEVTNNAVRDRDGKIIKNELKGTYRYDHKDVPRHPDYNYFGLTSMYDPGKIPAGKKQEGIFRTVNPDSKLVSFPVHRAFLQLEKDALHGSGNGRTLEFRVIDELHPTVVESAKVEKKGEASDGNVYDLLGHKVTNLQSGMLYVKAGKKFVQP